MSRFRNITANDLQTDETLRHLYVEAVSRGWWPNTNPAALDFLSLAEKALEDDTFGTPGRLFQALVKSKYTGRITNSQEVRAQRRFNSPARDRLVERAAETLPRNQSAIPPENPAFGDGHPSGLDTHFGVHHSIMMQCAMPQHPLPPTQRQYEAKHGRALLEIQAGSLADPNSPGKTKKCPIPYGSRPRIILPYINGYSALHKTREIDMGKSLRRFMESLGIGVDGRRALQIVSQVEALAAAQITLHEWQDDTVTSRVGRIADGITFWLKRDQRQALVWQPTMLLSAEYYDSLQNHQAPINMEHLGRLTRSPRRMDLYAWLSYRAPRIRKGESVVIACSALHRIFGHSLQDPQDFRRRLREDLTAIYRIHPFRMSLRGDMLILGKSRPPVQLLPK